MCRPTGSPPFTGLDAMCRMRSGGPIKTRILPCAMVAMACVADSPEGAPFVLRDSAGIEIVESDRGSWTAEEAWTLSAEPELVIGVADGDPRYQLFEISDALVLADGRIVVANAGTQEIRYYDPRGRHLLSVGGEGDGPGEFRSLQAIVRLASDSLLAFDDAILRLSVFDVGGAFVRSAALQAPADGRSFLRVLGGPGDGSLLVWAGHTYVAGAADAGPQRHPVAFFRYATTGELLHDLGDYPGLEAFVESTEQMMRVNILPFTRRTLATAEGGRVFIGTNDRYEIRVLSPEGDPLRLIRSSLGARAVTPADLTAYVDRRATEIEDPARRREEAMRLRSLPLPETMPAFSALLADPEGGLWVERHRSPADGDGASPWSIFGPEGALRGEVELPAGFRPLEVGRDYVLGVSEDELGVEFIHRHRIEKPQIGRRASGPPGEEGAR